MEAFADRLVAAVKRCGNPVLVGLDPRFESLPAGLRGGTDPANFAEVAVAYREFCRDVIDVVADRVAVVKPQAAFFEQLGPAGMTELWHVIGYAREKGLLVILDGKRNDIGSTAEAYAAAYLGQPPASCWGADALTVSPYLGDDSLTPFVDASCRHGAGIFVLVKTSNPGGGLFQDLIADGRPLYRHVAEHVEGLNSQQLGQFGFGPVGAVVGATYPQQLGELRAVMPHAWILVPGFGAQGGSSSDVAPAFDARGLGAIVNNSRGIIFAYARPEYRQRYGDAKWQEAVAEATGEMIEQLRTETPAGKLGE